MKKLNLKIGIIFATSILLGSLESATAQGNLVFNGGFDANANGWTANNVAVGWYSQGGNPGGNFALVPLSSSSPSIISQTINNLTAGGTYLVSGNYCKIKSDPSNLDFGVAVDGNYLFRAVDSQESAWQSFSFSFTANSSSVVLGLASRLNGTGVGYDVDSISLAAVPEPNTLCLLGMGGAAGLFFMRRKVSLIRS